MNKLNKTNLLIFALLLAVFLPFIALSFFSYPSADDLIFSFTAQKSGVFENVYNYYFEWSGRYFFSFLIAINPLVYNWEFGYQLLPLMIISSAYIGLLLLHKLFLCKPLVNKSIDALLLLAVLIQSLPSPVEALYWMSASITYTLPFLMLFGLISILYLKNQSVWSELCLGILALMICGSNELIMVLTFEVLIILLLFHTILKKPNSKIVIALSFIVVGIIISSVAPGNYRRMEFFPLHGNFVDSVYFSIYSFFRISAHVFSEPALFMLMLVAFIQGYSGFTQFSALSLPRYIAYILPVASILLLISLYFPGYYAMGIAPPPRVHNFVAISMVVLLYVNMLVLGMFFGKSTRNPIIHIPLNFTKILAAMAILFLFTGFKKRPGEEIRFTSNTVNAWYDLVFEAKAYSHEMNNRNIEIIDARETQKDTLILNPFVHKPYTTFYLDITDNPEHWINVSFREYYRLKNVTLQK